jgi:Tfp pilus assembly protein PilV
MISRLFPAPQTWRARRPFRARAAEAGGFTVIEVLLAAFVLVAGLLSVLGILIVAGHTSATNRVRQAGTNLAREVVEQVRSLPYTQLTSATIAGAVQPLVPGSALSGNGLSLNVTRSIYTYNVSFSACSLDDPSDGYGSHSDPPASGGSWCPDVAANGTADTTPDDYKRVSVTVTPTGTRNTPTVQQTVLIYNRITHGPAVSCLSTTPSCPGSNVQIITGSSQLFYVTTTAQAAAIQWFVNGSAPPAGQVPSGALDPYNPSSTTSQFSWVFPTPDGTYAISAQAFDQNGNSGTKSTLQIKLNRHDVIAPTNLTAGWNNQINGVDVEWIPSVDQDVLYYNVYRQSGNNAPVLVCSAVNGTACTDMTAPSPNPPATPNPCTSSTQSYTTSDLYWVKGVDKDPSGNIRESTQQSPSSDANLCDHPPLAPTGLTAAAGNGAAVLNWSIPASPVDPDSWDKIIEWRVYRWSGGPSPQFPGGRFALVGSLTGLGTPNTTFTDPSADPGGTAQNYCVTSIDTHLNESPCSNVVSG